VRPASFVLAFCAGVSICGCERVVDSPPIRAVGPDPDSALVTIALPLKSLVPLAPRYVRELSDTQYLAADARSRAVWLLSTDSASSPVQVVTLERDDAKAVAGLAVGSTELGVLLSDGSVRVFARTDWSEIQTIPYGVGGTVRPLGIEASGEGEWAVLAEEMRGGAGGTDRVAVLVLRRVAPDEQDVLWERPKWRLAELGPEARDLSSLTSDGKTVLIGGSHPPRIVTYESGTEFREIQLREVPQRRLTAADMRAQRRVIAQVPPEFRERIPVHDTYPALLKAWRSNDGIAVVGAGEGDSVMLDWYCGDTYERTLLAGVQVRNVWPLQQGVAFLRVDSSQTEYSLEIFTAEQMDMSCE